MANRILVLGATGNIGSFLCQDLKRRNTDIIGGVPASEMDKLREMSVEGVTVDFGNAASLDNAMRGIDSLFMLLPMAEPMSGWGRNIIEAAKRNNLKFILRSSIIDAHPDSSFFLFRIHGEIDQVLRDSGIPFAIVHPNSFMQNFAVYYVNSINNNGTFSFAFGDARDSYNDVRDIAAVDAAVLSDPESHRNREYNVTGPQALSSDDIAGILSGATGRNIHYVPVSEDQYAANMRKGGMPDWAIQANLSLDRHIASGRQAVVIDTVKNLTGRDPIPFEQFARDYADTWKKAAVSA